MNTDRSRGFVLRHPKLSYTELVGVLTKLVPVTEKAWYLVASPTNSRFDDFDRTATSSIISQWTQGRVFCASSEIRWNHASGQDRCDVLVLFEAPVSGLEGFEPVGTEWRVVSANEERELVVWGSPIDSSARHLRAESRLPKRLQYPVSCDAGRLQCLYYCTPSGEVQFTRLKAVK